MGKSSAEKSRKCRAKLKENPEKWKEYLHKQAINVNRHRERKANQMTGDDIEMKRTYERERKQRQRDKHKKLVVKLATSGKFIDTTIRNVRIHI